MKATFQDKSVIITGAYQGLGLGVAKRFLAEGAQVAVIDMNPEVEKLAEELNAAGGKCVGIKGNLSAGDERDRAFEAAIQFFGGGLDVLVNAAGIQRRHKSEEFPISEFETVLNVNLTSLFAMCQLAGRVMLKQGSGKIVNFASMLSYFGGYTVPAYAASKGGVAQVTKALANEWAMRGVCVNAIAPGYMDTEMNTALINDPGRNTEILARIPAGRWGTPDDIAGVVLFLSGADSDYINGAVIPVDGGYLGR